MTFVCCDCNKEIKAENSKSNADGSATIQCIRCHAAAHETSNGKHNPTFDAFEQNRNACWHCTGYLLDQ